MDGEGRCGSQRAQGLYLPYSGSAAGACSLECPRSAAEVDRVECGMVFGIHHPPFTNTDKHTPLNTHTLSQPGCPASLHAMYNHKLD